MYFTIFPVGRDVLGAPNIARSDTVGRGVPDAPQRYQNDIMHRMNNREISFTHQLRQFRILTIVGYSLLLFIIAGMVVASELIPRTSMPIPPELPIGLVGVVLFIGASYPFLLAAYDKTTCPHCGKRIEDGHFYWHGIKCNGPTLRYWKLFFGNSFQCPHCHKEVRAYGRPRTSDPTLRAA